MNNLATHLVIECINTHHEWKFARGIVKRAFKCSIITSLKFSDWVAFTNTRQTMIDALDKKDGNEFFCLMASNNFVQEGISCLETFLDTVIQRYSKAVHSWIGNIVSKFKSASGGASVISAAPTFTIPDKQLLHIVEVIGTENIKNKSRCFTAARAALASISNMLVNESNQDAVSIMKASRNWDVFMSAGGSSMIALKLVDDSFKTLMESIKDICTQQVESMVDSAATKHSTTLAEHFAQDMCTKFVSPIQCEYERIIGSRKGHYDKDGCKMINDFNGLIKTLPELKDTTLAELNRFKKTLDPLVQRISKFCDSSQGLIVSVQKDVEAFGKGKGEATAYASHTFTEEKGVSHTPIAVAAAKAFTLPPPHPTESADDHSSDNSSSSDSPRDDASVPKAAPPQRESDTGMTHANNAEGSEPIMKPAVDAKTMTKTSVADILEDATKAGTSSDEVIQNKLEFLNDVEFDGLLIVDDDWEFGHEDGDPYEDLAHFLRWLASYGPDYINAVVNTQDKPDSAMATTQAAKESLETALENIMDIEETTKNIISAEPIATSTLNDFKKNDAPVENPGDQELDKRLKRLDFWALIHCSDLKEESSSFRTFAGTVDAINRTQPLMFILENVDLGDCTEDDSNGAVIATALGNEGYATRMIMLKATDFGLPQRRTRLFILGVNIRRANAELRNTADQVLASALTVYLPNLKLKAPSVVPRLNSILFATCDFGLLYFRLPITVRSKNKIRLETRLQTVDY
ncbi:Modification methylase HaeII [Durusdinium trenchii]|uniref:Modification methylase HaeII n=1 Tax=Durusdinium trenchii TaxID=1381693 RepID=A0ABP0P4T9_9DINO